jgi:hypothetical protein
MRVIFDHLRLWVPDIGQGLCGLGIFMKQAAEAISSDSRANWVRWHGGECP